MRLTKIKLAGFKSFVDPTTFHLPSNLVGIVGPNGCGKSNIIDAVRWVMGESSARTLRGESMADVIFNGSTARRPVGQASIELVFDNSAAKLQGPWTQYGEISVRRLVSRSGQSHYFLNGTRCRRRDITGLFLGTGLGPRSYAIIEQGMIARVIEAKPDELRIFFEEAAGISKYKERRRETEVRIRHTRENLERLNDLREELDKQLQHLQRQARSAERYKQLRAEERQLKAELTTLRWRELELEVKHQETLIRTSETELEATLAAQRKLEAQLEQGRLGRSALDDEFNEVQGRFYELGARISRLEQALAHRHELRRRQDDELLRIEQTSSQIQEQADLDEKTLAELAAALAECEPLLAQARVEEQVCAERLRVTEAAQRNWQAAWDICSQRVAECQRGAEVERTHIEHFERQSLQQQRQVERLRLEQDTLEEAPLGAELEELRLQEQHSEQVLVLQQEALAEVDARIEQTRQQLRQLALAVDQKRARVQTERGRLASLQALQEAALGRDDVVLVDWLQQQQLQESPRLAECISVESGWESAVEAVLGARLEALCVRDLASLARQLADLPYGEVVLYEVGVDDNRDDGCEATAAGSLLDKLRAPWPLAGLLAGVRAVADLDAALVERGGLAAGQSLVTPDGVWLGRNWVWVNRAGDERRGVLAREREIRELEARLAEDEAVLDQHIDRQDSLRAELQTLERERARVQEDINHEHRDFAELQARTGAMVMKLEQFRTRRNTLLEQSHALVMQMEENEQTLVQARTSLEAALLELEQADGERQQLVARRDSLRAELHQHRASADSARAAVSRQTLALASLENRQSATRQALERLQLQHRQLHERRVQLTAELVTTDEAQSQEELDDLLGQRSGVEEERAGARRALEDQDAELDKLEQSRKARQEQAQTQREKLEVQRLQWGEARVRRQTLLDQLVELGVELDVILEALPATATQAEWQTRLQVIAARIQRLGPINLAAIDEFAQLSERKHYLDEQNDDLMQALGTLEDAMLKIDKETRSRLQDTFDRVNKGLQSLFPRLFGGGRAHLELTGSDVLDAGVTIMARPPGKHISNIHLLSGGEKALTAVALVFAIFQLNPAPFCMLDEVDAPLDEANVGRFGELVREMSEQVQFILITHNKSTMEIARHLSGVTMQEPGVSRLVAVDVDEAAHLAAV